MNDEIAIEAEYWVITTPEGVELLADVAVVRRPLPADLERWRKRASPDRVAAAARLADARRRGAGKFSRAAEMWLDATGTEQATAEEVARHKAARFPAGVVVDLCSGVGGDALAVAGRGGDVLAVDRDRGMGRRLLWNAGVHGVADRVAAVTADAERFTPPPGAWVHVDPDRRSGRPRAGRANRLDGYCPGLPALRSIVSASPGGALKLGPASDFDEAFGGPEFEVELVSLRGECKEATVWFGGAATCRRRATRLPEGATWTDRDGPAGYAAAGPVLGLVFDPDPSLSRAGLIDGFAAVHGLSRAADGADLLTGSSAVPSPFLTPFEVVAVFPLDMKRLKREVAARRIGPLEVKTKGVDLTPEAVRERLRPEGDRPGTLILVGGQSPGRAILATRPNRG